MTSTPRPLPAAPDYDGAHLRHVMTSAAASLGLTGFQNRLRLPEASATVVLMVDGLGDALLARYSGHARFLASAWRSSSAEILDVGVPTTTAASLASLGTGTTPGQHGLVGYDVLAPELDRTVNMLGGWDAEIDPAQWQRHPSVLHRAQAAGAAVLTASRPKFVDSGLTQAVLGGGEFRGAARMDARFSLTAEWIQQQRTSSGVRQGPAPRQLVYLYVDELDKTGHRYGVDSAQWLQMLETLDAEAERFTAGLRRRYGDQVSVLLTADHGMIDIAAENRLDFSGQSPLLDGVRHTGGEPRLVQLYAEPGTAPETIAAAWDSEYGDRAWVLTREQAIAAGWFGAVEDRVAGRIGDVLVAAHSDIALYHCDRVGQAPMDMVGQHGSLTEAERRVPLLRLGA
ncbi:alkaline phosphatase family protein [Nesterenkonia sp. E16_7]|uniref:alkaline phosphatase family protein n=1 Tax=unclassified Nesterenkonia TaxID=2629769 RepID=UPI001A91404E|nr:MULTISPECIES: nucleotide pyrophosphatase/phosphodiesterase family protein [unclassified Nesterenkonia]MBO0596039.1 alkaline phosphatase family protein [Nesterenkonia sp. E16_10]MBO0599361.1 alkaline phosphatase family protein [Nesterenkonia sp. E16_7]